MTPTSAPGNKPSKQKLRRFAAHGFTLIELLVVLAIIALGAALVTAALPDGVQSKLEEEGNRLAALFESARAQSRATGQTVSWQPAADVPFRFVGLPKEAAQPTHWMSEGVSAEVVGAAAVVLGPEPILPAQRIVLRLEDRRVVLASDGLSAFAVTESGAP
jgi:general secretion pathway protein H